MGASGGIGQPLSLLLKQSPLVSQLNLYDIVHTPGVAADLSHINSRAKVQGFVGPDQLKVYPNLHIYYLFFHAKFKSQLFCPKISFDYYLILFLEFFGRS